MSSAPPLPLMVSKVLNDVVHKKQNKIKGRHKPKAKQPN